MKYMSWEEYTALCDKLSREVSGETIDAVVGINRGGLIIGGIIAHKLGVPLIRAHDFMTCYFRHLNDVFKKSWIEVTKENKREVDKIIHSIIDAKYKDCPTT